MEVFKESSKGEINKQFIASRIQIIETVEFYIFYGSWFLFLGFQLSVVIIIHMFIREKKQWPVIKLFCLL